MCKSKFKPAMLAAFALLVAAPIAGADPARVVSQAAETTVYGALDQWAITAMSDAADSTPDAASIAGMRMNAAAEHYGVSATRDLRSPDASDAAAATPLPSATSDLRSPDARDAALPRVTPTAAPVLAPATGDQPALAPSGSDFPWAGMLVGLGLAAMAGLLALVAMRGSRPRPLGR